ncbi:hypothetical protein Droror1_Dr00008968 [Drosera rotundifolia]
MRSSGCTFQQALTQEASAMVKQAVTLARRRGHTQVTPLHVAQAMLSASSGLLRAACLQSHSHPFQCRALELCFNVALNRLPTSTSTSMLGLHSYQPTISNALIAAFKRAQAHQRRGTVENQQQPILIVKIELEQLIVSILDDPSVSRVMREAGFSSTVVKGKVEQALSMEMSSRSAQPLNAIKSKDHSSPLQNLNFSSNALDLSLTRDREVEGSYMGSKRAANGPNWLSLEGGDEKARHDHLAKLEIEARSPLSSKSNIGSTASSNLPSWLQEYKDHEIKRPSLGNHKDQDSLPVLDLCKKWNFNGDSAPDQLPRTMSFDRRMMFPSSTFGFSYDQQYFHQNAIQQSYNMQEPNFTMSIQEHNYQKQPTLSFFSTTPAGSTPNSTSSSEVMETESSHWYFKEYNDENLKNMCIALEKIAPRQKEIIHDIVNTVLTCRSGKGRRKGSDEIREDTWFLFRGMDIDGKEKIGRELSRLVFGSERKYMSVSPSNFSSSTKAESSEDSRNKRPRDEEPSCCYMERFMRAMLRNPHRVFFLDEFDQVMDYSSQMSIKRAIEKGSIIGSNGEEIRFHDAIIILSCQGGGDSMSRDSSPSSKRKVMEEEMSSPCVSLDLNICINGDGSDDDEDDGFGGELVGLLGYVDKCIKFKLQVTS